MKPDLFDILVVVGLLLICAGIAMISIPWALIIGGIGLVVLGVIGSLRKATLKKDDKEAEK
jgi:hypothetical protein